MKGVNYSGLITIFLEALKEQQQQIDIAIFTRVGTNTIVAFDKLRQPNSSLPELVEGNTKIGTTRMNAAIPSHGKLRLLEHRLIEILRTTNLKSKQRIEFTNSVELEFDSLFAFQIRDPRFL
jgi:hypothetical protein